jgi:cytochrome c5
MIGHKEKSRRIQEMRMRSRKRGSHHPPHFLSLLLIGIGVMTVLFSLGGIIGFPNVAAAQSIEQTPTAIPTVDPMHRNPIGVPDLPATATQADYGAEIYRLVCRDCHGDHGQGLTADWIATWAPEDQNCWQSKCHAANHPPDGFSLPHYVPPIVGAQFMSRFKTAMDLYNYISQAMPWQDPGYLALNQYWQLTAFLLRLNGMDPGQQVFNDQNATSFAISQPLAQTIPGTVTPNPTRTPVPFVTNSSKPPDWLVILIIILIVGGAGSGLWFYSRKINQ